MRGPNPIFGKNPPAGSTKPRASPDRILETLSLSGDHWHQNPVLAGPRQGRDGLDKRLPSSRLDRIA